MNHPYFSKEYWIRFSNFVVGWAVGMGCGFFVAVCFLKSGTPKLEESVYEALLQEAKEHCKSTTVENVENIEKSKNETPGQPFN